VELIPDVRLSKKPKVAFLFATYKPGAEVVEQIASLVSQKGIEFHVYWGDDGSSPEQIELIEKILAETSWTFFQFEHVGAAQNFMTLLSKTKDEDYFAFVDQDDVWLENKIINHITGLSELADRPACSHSNSALMRNETITFKPRACHPQHSLTSLLVENCFQGCTMVLNRKMRDVVLSKPFSQVRAHDWWIGLLACTLGTPVFVPGVDMHYRLHDSNDVGYPTLLKKISNVLRRPPGRLIDQAQLLIELYGQEMPPARLAEISEFLDRFDKPLLLRLFGSISDVKRRRSWLEDLLRRVSMVVKKP
jgi:glycosyltransferase involved in cell wall biosynthesis